MTAADDKTTQSLVSEVALTRARAAADVHRLARELTPERVKDRALDAAERSLESVALRAARRLAQSPRRLVGYVRQHPFVGTALAVGATAVIWGVARRRRH